MTHDVGICPIPEAESIVRRSAFIIPIGRCAFLLTHRELEISHR